MRKNKLPKMSKEEFFKHGYLAMAEFFFNAGLETRMYRCLLLWASMNPIYSCDDLGLCNGPNNKHDCVDCPKKS